MTSTRRSPLVLDIERPTSFLVLSIEDHGIMEFLLHFRRSA